MDDARDFDDLVSQWTLLDRERELAQEKRIGRLGFALALKAFVAWGRFPVSAEEFSSEVVGFVARQLDAEPAELDGYAWSGRTGKRHRSEVRELLGFRECSVSDAERLTAWLGESVCVSERDPARVVEELSGRCLAEKIEPPTAGRAERIVRSALSRSEQALTARIADRLGARAVEQLERLLADDSGDQLALIRSVPGNVSLNTLLAEILKLRAVRAVGVPADAFAGVAPRVVARWRDRAAVESPSHLRRHSRDLRLTLLAALVQQREQEITDTLVDLFISTVHRIGARADRRVTQELVKAFKRVTGKENILFSIAEASLSAPEAPVRQVVFPAVAGGEQTLRDLVAEFKTSGPEYRRTVQTTLRASYTGHYRRGLIELLDVLELRSNNQAHRPVLDALELVRAHADGRRTYYPDELVVPRHRWVLGEWQPLVFTADGEGRERVVRAVYEICTFQALREQLRCKEIWVVGADRWRNPDEDLPSDFESRRDEYYATLRKPLDASAFIGELREELHHELGALAEALPAAAWVEIADRGSRGAVKLAPLDALPEPKQLGRVKELVAERWGTVPLVDMLKEAVLRTGAVDAATADAKRGDMSREDLAERLILALFAYGTNTGIRAISNGRHSERDIRYVRSRYLTPAVARTIATQIANATFAAREHAVWGRGTTSVASDSTHFGAFDQNIFTEWHSRYGGRGVLIYWHVEKKSMAIHSQLISCSASEVAAMIDGAIRHGTTMEVEANYTDTHGQSEIGFGITRLLGFDLLPRIKRINHVRLYRPEAGPGGQYAGLEPALTRALRWDVIAEQYDQMIRYATAIRSGTASTEAILRRFARANAMHPTYQAMIEVGRAQRSIFIARYLRDRDLQREINAGLNVMESWNQANAVIFYGKGGDLASNRREEQELSVLALRVLQAALVYVNTLMVQEVLAEPGAPQLAAEDLRGLTPLFWSHVAPYGEVRLDISQRIPLAERRPVVTA